jgi:predicted ATP-grasp superfamily ATP-dependent carboligase
VSGKASGRRLIVLGASARAAAQSAARAGFEPHAIDLFADRDLVAMCPAVRIERYPAGFLPALAAAPEATWIYTGGLENYPRLVERMAGVRPLWGNSGASLRGVRDPWRLSRVLADEGFRVPDLWSPGIDRGGGKWLVKPRLGSGGLGVRWASESDFASAGGRHVTQQYVEGECCSATYVAAGGQAMFVGATRQLVGRDWGVEPPFIYVGSIAPPALKAGEHQMLVRLGDMLAQRFGLVGLVGVDFVRAGGEIWPLEVNPRYTASAEVLERVTGMSLIDWHAAACTSEQLPPPVTSQSAVYAGKAVVYARQNCAWKQAAADDAPSDWPVIADIPHGGQRFAAGQPMVTVFAVGDSLAAVEHTLRVRRDQILAAVEAANYQPEA